MTVLFYYVLDQCCWITTIYYSINDIILLLILLAFRFRKANWHYADIRDKKEIAF